MAKLLKYSTKYTKARNQFSGLKTINDQFSLHDDINVTTFDDKLKAVENAYSEVNQLKKQQDAKRASLKKLETELNDYTQRVLSGIGSKFGFDSEEYEKAGGVRKSKRATPKRNGIKAIRVKKVKETAMV